MQNKNNRSVLVTLRGWSSVLECGSTSLIFNDVLSIVILEQSSALTTSSQLKNIT